VSAILLKIQNDRGAKSKITS